MVAVAQDETPAPDPAQSTDRTEPPTAPQATRESQPQVSPQPAEEQEDRGFFSRMNPARLFRRDGETRNMVTPLPPREGNSVTPLDPDPRPAEPKETESVVRQLPTVEPDEEPPQQMARAENTMPTPNPPTQRPVRRYEYSTGRVPQPGDREAAERLFDKAQEAKAQSNYVQASVYFAAAAEADPSWYSAYYHLGMISFQSGDWRRALSAFETALAINPDSSNARYNFALTLQKAKYPKDAAEQLEKLLERDPQDVRAHLLLGNLYAQELNEIRKASRHYQEVLALEPRHSQATAIRYWLAEHLR